LIETSSQVEKKYGLEELIKSHKAKQLYQQLKFDLLHCRTEKLSSKNLNEMASGGKENKKNNHYCQKAGSKN
jgi:hypothetical protein